MDAGITPLIYKQCEWKSHFGSGSRAYDQDHYEMWCRDPHVNLHYNEPELAAIIQRWVNARDVFFAFDHWTKSLKFIMVDDLRATCPNYDWIDIACVGQFPCLTSLGLVYIAKAPIDILMQALKMGKTIPVLFESESSVCKFGKENPRDFDKLNYL